MKKHLALLFIIAAFIYSCEKTRSVDINPPSIVGTWIVTNDTVKDYDKTGLTSATANTYNKGEVYRFSANGSGLASTDTSSAAFTYTLTGGDAVLNYPAQNYKGDEIDTARIGALTSTGLELIYKGYFFGTAGSTYYLENDVFLTKQTPISE